MTGRRALLALTWNRLKGQQQTNKHKARITGFGRGELNERKLELPPVDLFKLYHLKFLFLRLAYKLVLLSSGHD